MFTFRVFVNADLYVNIINNKNIFRKFYKLVENVKQNWYLMGHIFVLYVSSLFGLFVKKDSISG